MTISSTKILCRDAKKVERYWFYEVDGDKWRGHSGHTAEGSADVPSGWKTCKAKNAGKKNARTPEEQAAEEAEAEFRKKLDREYRRTREELDSVPPSPMLAHKIKDMKKPFRFLAHGSVFVQPKLDGIRMNASRKFGPMSRDYQPFGQSVAHIMGALAPIFDTFPDAVFDGELYNHRFKSDFNALSSLIRRQDMDAGQLGKCQQFLQYHVYDLPSGGIGANAGFRERSKMLQALGDSFALDFSSVVIVPTYAVQSIEEANEHRDAFLAAGYEGMMWRTDEPYEHDVRSWSLLKDKDFIDAEFPIMRLINGEGNWDGIPKAIEFMMPGDVRGEDGNRPKASIKGDMTFCRGLTELAPKFATIRYFQLTPAGVPRMPVAVDFHINERRD